MVDITAVVKTFRHMFLDQLSQAWMNARLLISVVQNPHRTLYTGHVSLTRIRSTTSAPMPLREVDTRRTEAHTERMVKYVDIAIAFVATRGIT